MINNTLRCSIIEDEPLAQELLEKYIRRVSSLELTATFDDAIVAFDQLPAINPDIIFLDVNMPEMTGIEFLRAYPLPHPVIIITSANPTHALDGFEFGVTDYLLKPIMFDRFLKAIGRARDKINGGGQSVLDTAGTTNTPLNEERKSPAEFIYFKTDKKLEQVHYDEIVYVESLGDYVKVFLPDRFFITLVTMKKLAEILPGDRFLRIHRSCIVQLQFIQTLEGNTVVTRSGQELIIGPNYRDEVKLALRKRLIP